MESKIKCLNRDVIKYIAMFTMFLNHFAHVFFQEGTLIFELLVDIGYFTAIPMCYFLVEGYGYTRSKKAYGKRLFLFAIISQIPFMMVAGESGKWLNCPLNMLFTLFLCFVMLTILDNHLLPFQTKNRWIWGIVMASCVCDWPLIAPMATYWFWEAKGNKKQTESVFLFTALLHGLMNFVSRMEQRSFVKNICLTIGATIPILIAGVIIIYFYNGKRMERGKTFSKYFFYWFYPVHLLVLGILRMKML